MSKIKGNIGVERVVLAGICQFGKDAYYDVSDIVSPNTFSLDANQALYKCLEKVLTQIDKPDATSIMAAADSLGLSDLLIKNKVDVEYIRSLFAFPIKELKNVRPHAKQLAKIEIIRKEQSALYQAQRELDDFDGTETVDKILGVGETAIFTLANQINGTEEGPRQIVAGARERLNELAKNPIKNVGLPIMWEIFNSVVGRGIRPGVSLIGARPGIGKSTIAINGGLHVSSLLNVPTFYVDTELTKEEQENRILAAKSGVDIELIETGEFALSEQNKIKVEKAISDLEKIPFKHAWVGGMEFEEIVSVIRRWIYKDVGFNSVGKPNPHFLLYDYFKLMNESGLGNIQEYQKIGFQISYLSDFCKQYGTPCLAFTQLNRDGITKDTSDIISQSDRLLWLCTSCAVFREKTDEEMANDGGMKLGNRKMHFLKTRYGPGLKMGDYICMQFDGKSATIKELGTRYALQKQNQFNDSGFEIEENNNV